MNLSDTARLRTLTLQRAVVYDGDAPRAERVAEVLRTLGLEPLLIDHSALMRAVIQAPSTPPALLIGDVADCDWRELGAALREQLGDVPVVAYGSSAVSDQLLAALGPRLQRLQFPFKHTALAAALRVPVEAALEEAGDVNMPTGTSPAVREVSALIRQVAAHDSSVLILGESGTGKELAARAIHDASPRRQRPFVAINCGAIPETLLESELFGYEKGAFTGAVRQTKGKIELASGGTLFLDEIGDMPSALQVKLLRFLQERRIDRLGGRVPVEVDVRVICATHQNLEKQIADGRFREDLFYRISGIPIFIPPLRERGEDAVLIARHLIEKFALEQGKRPPPLGEDAIEAIRRHPWRGNVRELENRIRRAIILSSSSELRATDLDLAPGAPEPVAEAAGKPPVSLREARERAERQIVHQALHQAQGNLSAAARLLEVSRPTLYALLRQYRLEQSNEDADA
jgi:DNA-binding NtrC family response regulator